MSQWSYCLDKHRHLGTNCNDGKAVSHFTTTRPSPIPQSQPLSSHCLSLSVLVTLKDKLHLTRLLTTIEIVEWGILSVLDTIGDCQRAFLCAWKQRGQEQSNDNYPQGKLWFKSRVFTAAAWTNVICCQWVVLFLLSPRNRWTAFFSPPCASLHTASISVLFALISLLLFFLLYPRCFFDSILYSPHIKKSHFRLMQRVKSLCVVWPFVHGLFLSDFLQVGE